MAAFASSADMPASNDEDSAIVNMDEVGDEEVDKDEEENDDDDDDDDDEEDDEIDNPMDVVEAQIQRDRYHTIVDPLLSLAKKEHYLLVQFWQKISRDIASMTAIELDVKLKQTAAQRAGN